MSKGLQLLVSIGIPQLVAAAGAYFTITGTGSWYQRIEKPSWNPPSSVFGPTWTVLYILMGIAFFLVWRSARQAAEKRSAITFWIIQLALNLLWTILFFRCHAIGWAVVEIAALWVAILLTIVSFGRIHRRAAFLLLPYLAWVTFAGVLTFTIWRLNN
jgi:tryptophan-rich sensory protein